MPEEEVTGATDTSEEVTHVEEPGSTESGTQDSTEKLSQFEARLRELEEARQQDAEARAEAERRAQEAEEKRRAAEERAAAKEREYKGLQRETGQKTNELKVLREQLANQTITQTKLDQMEKLVRRLAQVQLSPEEVDQLQREMEVEQIRLENERLRQEAQARATAAQAPERRLVKLPPEQKQTYYDAYFAREFPNVDPLELTDEEWAAGVFDTPPEWASHVRAAFQRRQEATEKKKEAQIAQSPEAIAAQIRQQLKTEFDAQRAEDSKKQAEAHEQIRKLQEELAEAKRIAEETANRQKGMDRVDRSPSSTASKKVAKKLHAVPESWLYGTPEQKKAYHEAMNDKSLRDQILAGLTQG